MVKRILRPALILSFIVSTFSFGACDPAVNQGYNGEVLASFKGKVSNSLSSAPDGAQVRLMWGKVNPNGTLTDELNIGLGETEKLTALLADFLQSEYVEVTGGFPASFRLDVLTPPDESLLLDFAVSSSKKIKVALGLIVTTKRVDSQLTFDDIIGIEEKYIVLYVPNAEDATALNVVNNTQYVAGFNLLPSGPDTPITPRVEKCIEDYDTLISACIVEHSTDSVIDFSSKDAIISNDAFEICKEEFAAEYPDAGEIIDAHYGVSHDVCARLNQIPTISPNEVELEMVMRENALITSPKAYFFRGLLQNGFSRVHSFIDGYLEVEE